MGISEQIRNQLIANFKAEQAEHVQNINQGLLNLEKNPSADARQALLDDIFREAHSLKGAARAVGMATIESLGHAMEDILLQVKEGKREITSDIFDLLYQALDMIEQIIAQAESGQTRPSAKVLGLIAALEEASASSPTPDKPADDEPELTPEKSSPTEAEPAPSSKPTQPSPKKPPVMNRSTEKPTATEQPTTPILKSSDDMIRVSVNKLDTLMAQFSELLGTKIRIEQRLAETREMQSFAAQWHKEWLGIRTHYGRLIRNGDQEYDKDITALLNFANQTQEHIRTLNTQSNLLYRQLSNDTMRLSLVTNELQEEIKRLRMLPLNTITTTFERMVRDLARNQKKLIRLKIAGGETELDKRVLEQIKDPLMHLLRNAIDHGIEPPKERQQNGKPIEGEILLTATQQGHNVVITVKDNGRGLNLEAIKAKAVQQGHLNQSEVNRLSESEAAMLIFNAGLSTSKIITDISGRGVGMDVVRQNVADLQGTLGVEFVPQEGSTIKITLPLTLASSRGLLVRVGNHIYALPFSTVERMLVIKQEVIGFVEGEEMMTYQNRPVSLVWLEDLLELPLGNRDTEKLTVIIIAVAEKRLGLVVDSLEGEQEVVMKNLGKQLLKVSGIAGATVLGSGEVVLVLHAGDLLQLAASTHTRTTDRVTTTSDKEIVKHPKILVVDDSITTRTLEKNILEAAGYRVQLATNGEEAMSLLMTDELPNLIVSDVNMPLLDGFGLTERVKQNPRYTDIPVILVTSLDSPADKSKGIDVGADAYIVKSNFDQGGLLDTIEQLV